MTNLNPPVTPPASRYPYAVTAGAIATIIFVTAITFAADLYLPLKDTLKNAFTHHWVGKSVLATGLFTLVTTLVWFGKTEVPDDRLPHLLRLLSILAVAGTVLIFGFFVYETFGK